MTVTTLGTTGLVCPVPAVTASQRSARMRRPISRTSSRVRVRNVTPI